jgi:precorrin-2 dehydrogenase / sirohydrochlorin ferrochelatase
MLFMPINLDIQNKKVLIIGGGNVGLEKVTMLSRFTENIHVVGKNICDEIKSICNNWIEKEYHPDDLKGVHLVYAATNNRELNKQIKRDANNLYLLANVVDDPEICDFVSPAIYKKENMTVAVGSNGQDVRKSITWRNKIKEFLESD